MKTKILTLLVVLALSVVQVLADFNGTCGTNVNWELTTADSTLHISGNGTITNPTYSEHARLIKHLIVGEGVKFYPTLFSCYSVNQAIVKQDGKEALVKGYIVGWFNNKPNPGECVFSAEAPADIYGNVLIADSPLETSPSNVVCVELPAGAVCDFVNLGGNPDNLHKEVVVKGLLSNYNGLPGVETTSFAQIGTKTSDELSNEYAAQFLCYRVGIGSLDANTVAAMKAGDKVVVTAKILNFRGTYPTTVSKGTIISINGTVPEGAITAAEANAIAKSLEPDVESTETYTISGEVARIQDNAATTIYKNMSFYLKDETYVPEAGSLLTIDTAHYAIETLLWNTNYNGDIVPNMWDSIRSLTIGESVDTIDYKQFAGCTKLTSLTYNAINCNTNNFVSLVNLKHLTIGDKVTTLPPNLITGSTGITEVNIPNSVTNIGAYAFADCIGLSKIIIPNSVTNIGAYAFAGCIGLSKIIIPNSVTNIGSEAFGRCSNLINVTCYAMEPPVAATNSFANYNVFLKVPCSNLIKYQTDMCWGSFKYISCISGETVDVNDFSVIPSSNEALFAWPTEIDANTYTLVISKDNVVFCELTFNASGQLMGISFAPSSNGNNGGLLATATPNGFQFLVTNLDATSHYTYTFDVKNTNGSVIKSYNGSFDTDSYTGLEQNIINNIYTENGYIIYDKEFRIYDLLGREVTHLNGYLNGIYIVNTGSYTVKVVVK